MIFKTWLNKLLVRKSEDYTLMEKMDPLILMCSEKREFEAYGYKYIDHYFFEKRRILENTTTGKCIEYYHDRIQTPEEFDSMRDVLSGTLKDVNDTICICSNRQNILFNAELTERKHNEKEFTRRLIYQR